MPLETAFGRVVLVSKVILLVVLVYRGGNVDLHRRAVSSNQQSSNL